MEFLALGVVAHAALHVLAGLMMMKLDVIVLGVANGLDIDVAKRVFHRASNLNVGQLVVRAAVIDSRRRLLLVYVFRVQH